MIHQILSAIVEQLNEHIRNELGLSEDMVIASNLMDLKGGSLMQIENKVCLFVINIEEEKLLKNSSFQSNTGTTPTLFINLYIVAAANFPEPNYIEALRYISLVVEFFQGKIVFDRSNTPSLPSALDKISVEFFNQSMQELNNMWSLIGGKYIPSAAYKVKMIPFNQNMIKDDIGTILSGKDMSAARNDLFKKLGLGGGQ